MTRIEKETFNTKINTLNNNSILNNVAKNLSLFLLKPTNSTQNTNEGGFWNDYGVELGQTNQTQTDSGPYDNVRNIMNRDLTAIMNSAIDNYILPKKVQKLTDRLQDDLDKADFYKERLKRPNLTSSDIANLEAKLAELPDEGNGQIDKPSINQPGICWLMAGINSLASTETGQKFLEKNIKKTDKNGRTLFVVHLQEAENNGYHNGVYIFTKEEVLAAQDGNSFTTGDGDIAAYALAVEAYLKESGNKKDFKDGKYSSSEYPFRAYEILTGIERSYGDEETGVSHVVFRDKDKDSDIDADDVSDSFNKIKKLTDEKKAAFILSDSEHAFSVIGTDGDYLLVQESTFDTEKYSKMFELMPDKFPPTYKIAKDDLAKFKTYSSIQWEE